jgi:hypothetical protein
MRIFENGNSIFRKLSKSHIGNNDNKGYSDKSTIGLELFDLSNDPAESINLAAKNPIIVEELQILLHKLDTEMKRNKRKPSVYDGEVPPK